MAAPYGVPAEGAVITSDGVIGTSGETSIVFGVILTAGASGVCNLNLHEGTGTGGDQHFEGYNPDNGKSLYFPIPGGLHFVDGLYADISGTGASATIIYTQE